MSKRPAERELVSGKPRRKHFALSISKKVELLMRLDEGVPVQHLSDEYGVGTSTIYDIKKKREQILKFYGGSDVPKLMDKRKTLHQSKSVDMDRMLLDWIRECRSERFPLDRSMIMAQAKLFHKELNLTTSCEYSSGWFNRFKQRHGICNLNVGEEKIDQKLSSEVVQSAEPQPSTSNTGTSPLPLPLIQDGDLSSDEE